MPIGDRVARRAQVATRDDGEVSACTPSKCDAMSSVRSALYCVSVCDAHYPVHHAECAMAGVRRASRHEETQIMRSSSGKMMGSSPPRDSQYSLASALRFCLAFDKAGPFSFSSPSPRLANSIRDTADGSASSSWCGASPRRSSASSIRRAARQGARRRAKSGERECAPLTVVMNRLNRANWLRYRGYLIGSVRSEAERMEGK